MYTFLFIRIYILDKKNYFKNKKYIQTKFKPQHPT